MRAEKCEQKNASRFHKLNASLRNSWIDTPISGICRIRNKNENPTSIEIVLSTPAAIYRSWLARNQLDYLRRAAGEKSCHALMSRQNVVNNSYHVRTDLSDLQAEARSSFRAPFQWSWTILHPCNLRSQLLKFISCDQKSKLLPTLQNAFRFLVFRISLYLTERQNGVTQGNLSIFVYQTSKEGSKANRATPSEICLEVHAEA